MKRKLTRHEAIMQQVRKELKSHSVFLDPDLLTSISDALDTSKYHKVEVTRSAEEAGKWLHNVDQKQKYLHSALKERHTQSNGRAVFGTVTFGKLYVRETIRHGKATADSKYSRFRGVFDETAPFAVIIDSDIADYFRSGKSNRHHYETTLVIYCPVSQPSQLYLELCDVV